MLNTPDNNIEMYPVEAQNCLLAAESFFQQLGIEIVNSKYVFPSQYCYFTVFIEVGLGYKYYGHSLHNYWETISYVDDFITSSNWSYIKKILNDDGTSHMAESDNCSLYDVIKNSKILYKK